MTTLTDTQVVTASGGLVELGYSQISLADKSVTATTAAGANEIIAPLTVVCDGSPVLVEFFASRAYPDTTAGGRQLKISLWQDGAQSVNDWGFIQSPAAAAMTGPVRLAYRVTPTAGSHTFGVKAYVNAGTGYIEATTSAGAAPAFLRVSKIVTATQWPAVTTGTIICTSSTRPASPFVGQSIYETDTSLAYTYNGSAWVQTGNSTGAWTAFTPAWTNLTVGNGTTGARYVKVGRTVTYSGFITWGSTTSATSGYTTVSVPFTSANQAGYEWQGSVRIADAGTRGYPGECGIGSNATTMNFHHPEAGNFGAVNSTNPMTWTTNDSLYWTITYEAAS